MQPSDCQPYIKNDLDRRDEKRMTSAGVLLIRTNDGIREVLLGLEDINGDKTRPWLKALTGVPKERGDDNLKQKEKDDSIDKGQENQKDLMDEGKHDQKDDSTDKGNKNKKEKGAKKESSFDCAFRQLQLHTGVAFNFKSVREYMKVLWTDEGSCCAFYVVDTSAILRAPSVQGSIKSSLQKYVQDVQCIHTRTVSEKRTDSKNDKTAEAQTGKGVAEQGNHQAKSTEDVGSQKAKETSSLIWFDLASWDKLKSADWNAKVENWPTVEICNPVWDAVKRSLKFEEITVKTSELIATRLTFMQPFEDYRSKLLNPYNPFAFTMNLLKEKADQLMKSMHDEFNQKLLAEWLSGENSNKFSLIDVSDLSGLDADKMTRVYVMKVDTVYHFVYDKYSLKSLMEEVDGAINRYIKE